MTALHHVAFTAWYRSLARTVRAPRAVAPLLAAAGWVGAEFARTNTFTGNPWALPTFLVDPANDTWLTPKFSAQQFDIVTLRSVEQRRYLVRASTSGPSAVVDPLGRVVRRTEVFTGGAITGEIHPG